MPRQFGGKDQVPRQARILRHFCGDYPRLAGDNYEFPLCSQISVQAFRAGIAPLSRL
jgi:hypothetical protein